MVEQGIENKEPNETKYTTENMGEVTVKNDRLKYVYGKFNSEEIQIANLGTVGYKFKENFDYIMNIINQYSKIYEISKKAIIENFNNDENIRNFFNPHKSLGWEEKLELINKSYAYNVSPREFFHIYEHCYSIEDLFKYFDINIFENFEINKAVENLNYPRLYFLNNFSENYGNEKLYFEVQYRMSDEIDNCGFSLGVSMDSNFNIYDFDCSRPITFNFKKSENPC